MVGARPEYLDWLGQQPERDYTILMGATTYRLMCGFATESAASESDEPSDEDAATAELTNASKVVFRPRPELRRLSGMSPST